MAVKVVTIPDLGTVHLYKRRGVRSLRLTIAHDGAIKVSMPYWLPYAAGAEFARSKRAWIQTKQVVTQPLVHGTRIGKSHHLSFIAERGRTTMATRITTTGEIRIYHPHTVQSSHQSVQDAAVKASVRALKKQAQRLLPGRLRFLAGQHGFQYGTVKIKRMTSRWGSCTDQKDIVLNCYLMQLPWHLIDYVLLHELLHTRIMAHGQPFWSEMEAFVPNIQAVRKEIKAYRPILQTS
ncbi:MAG TPA: SprT family zinc-dependent metalloprotease [Verrucomicrobiae bacterium]|nr:SprT family zinc-dependent metalloprotease [Verrucomicrobiae bacterium]